MEKDIGVTLEEVLQLNILEDSVIIAGKNGLSRNVNSINVMEVPDILDWVSSGQLLVTTAYSLMDDISVLMDLVPRLNEAGVSGLGIKLKRYVGEIPAEVIALADQLDFPIFEIARKVSFSDVITAVLNLVLNKQTKVLQEMHHLHQSLTSTMLSGGNLTDIVKILYQRFGNSVAIESMFLSSFVIQASGDKSKRIYEILQENRRKRKLDVQWEVASSTYRTADEQLGDICCDRITVPIYSDQILYGHVYIWEDHHKTSNLELSAIESVTSLIALDIMEKISIIEIENNHKAGFLEDLLSADSRRQQKALGQARFFDFNPQVAHQVIVIRLRKSKQNFRVAGKPLFRMNTSVIGILQRLVQHTSLRILYVNNDSNIVILCENAPNGKPVLQEFLQHLSEGVAEEYLSSQVVIGVGRSYDSPSDLYRSRSEARRAATCSHLAQNNVVFYSAMGVSRLFSFDNVRVEAELFCDEMLKPLLDYDKEKDSELVKTLTAYFRCKGNLTRLAEELAVHYNTIIYRLQRIRDLTGFSLDNEADLLNLQVALKIHEMQSNE